MPDARVIVAQFRGVALFVLAARDHLWELYSRPIGYSNGQLASMRSRHIDAALFWRKRMNEASRHRLLAAFKQVINS